METMPFLLTIMKDIRYPQDVVEQPITWPTSYNPHPKFLKLKFYAYTKVQTVLPETNQNKLAQTTIIILYTPPH
jgi:hypothetical protein